VKDVARHGGTEAGSKLVTINGETFEFYYGCPPHNCGEHGFTVVFRRGGRQAWFFIEDGDKNVVGTLGQPSAAMLRTVQQDKP
jgi:hypothetical protein